MYWKPGIEFPVETSAQGSGVKCSEANLTAVSPRAFETVATLEHLLVCGRVPALVPVDLFRCVWRLERKEGV